MNDFGKFLKLSESLIPFLQNKYNSVINLRMFFYELNEVMHLKHFHSSQHTVSLSNSVIIPLNINDINNNNAYYYYYYY